MSQTSNSNTVCNRSLATRKVEGSSSNLVLSSSLMEKMSPQRVNLLLRTTSKKGKKWVSLDFLSFYKGRFSGYSQEKLMTESLSKGKDGILKLTGDLLYFLVRTPLAVKLFRHRTFY